MQMVSEVMTRNVQFVSPQESLQRAAQMMDDLNVGALPVCDGERLVGMITDRDITIRATSVGEAPGDTRVEEAMSGDVRWCFEDESLDDVMKKMANVQIRRVPVISHDDAHKLIGIVALGDLATRSFHEVDKVVEKVSFPSEPDRSQQSRAASAAGGGANVAAGGSAAGGAGIAGTPGTASGVRTADASGSTDNTGGTDAAGATGATGGKAGTAGSTGTDIGVHHKSGKR